MKPAPVDVDELARGRVAPFDPPGIELGEDSPGYEKQQQSGED
jgi:hypothetical protein